MSNDRKDVELTLKYGTLVPGVGLMRVLRGTTLGTSSDSFLFLISKVFRRGKWCPVEPCRAWIKEDVVVSRIYVDREPVQRTLAL